MSKKLFLFVGMIAIMSICSPDMTLAYGPDTVAVEAVTKADKAAKMASTSGNTVVATKQGDSITVVVPPFPEAGQWQSWSTLFGEPLTWLIALLSTLLPWASSFLPGLDALSGKTRHLAVAVLLILGVAIIGWPPFTSLIGILTGVLGYNLFSIFRKGAFKQA